MRMAFTAALAFAAFATAATAAPVAIRPVGVSPEFQQKIQNEYGEREMRELTEAVQDALTHELAQAGATAADAGAVAIEVVIEDAKPNRPTFKQLGDTPGLSMTSVGIGGARLSARIVDARTGAVLETVSYAWYENDIRDAIASTTWTDARRAIRRFAANVAEAVAQTDAKPPAS